MSLSWSDKGQFFISKMAWARSFPLLFQIFLNARQSLHVISPLCRKMDITVHIINHGRIKEVLIQCFNVVSAGKNASMVQFGAAISSTWLLNTECIVIASASVTWLEKSCWQMHMLFNNVVIIKQILPWYHKNLIDCCDQCF